MKRIDANRLRDTGKGATMRLIDIDAFRKDLGLAERCEDCERGARECQYDQIYTRMDFCGWLDDAEIIDAVPVVRCVDCKYNYGNAEGREYNPNDIICTYFDTDGMDASDYCSYGERSEDGVDR